MRIWHQSFTVLEHVPHYRDALDRHLRAVALPGTEIGLGVRHVRLKRPLEVRMDGQIQQGVILLP